MVKYRITYKNMGKRYSVVLNNIGSVIWFKKQLAALGIESSVSLVNENNERVVLRLKEAS